MYAIIEAGGRQIKVEAGKNIQIEKIDIPVGEEVKFDKVMLIRTESSCLIGTPYLEDVSVTGKVVDHFKAKKVIIFKHKRRKNYRRKRGHRQPQTMVRIESINLPEGALEN